MEFAPSDRVVELQGQLWDFMDEHVFPAEAAYEAFFAHGDDPHGIPPVMED